MNPFEDIEISNQLKNDRRSPHYGRYQLCFNQIYPFREPLDDRLALKTKDIELTSIIYDLFPAHIHRLIHFARPGDELGNVIISNENESILCFEMISDFIYIALEDICFAIRELAFVLEDCHFIIYSSGDADTRWLDEYKVENGILSMCRNFCDDPIFMGRLDYYIKRAFMNPTDSVFLRFTLYQLYDRLLFWTNRYNQIPDWIETFSNMEKVNKTEIYAPFKIYFEKFYSLDEECPSWDLINKKYNLI